MNPWCRYFIPYFICRVAAFATMFSTTITVLDAYPRVLSPIVKNLFPDKWRVISQKSKERLVWFWFFLMIIGATIIIAFAAKTMVHMITIATVLSFLLAPIMAWLNFKVVTDTHMPIEARPGVFLRVLSWTGLSFLVIFSVVYLYWVFSIGF